MPFPIIASIIGAAGKAVASRNARKAAEAAARNAVPAVGAGVAGSVIGGALTRRGSLGRRRRRRRDVLTNADKAAIAYLRGLGMTVDKAVTHVIYGKR